MPHTSKIQQVQAEIISALLAASAPLSNSDLLPRCPSARHRDDISCALNALKGKKTVIEGPRRAGGTLPGGLTRTYLLPGATIVTSGVDVQASEDAVVEPLGVEDAVVERAFAEAEQYETHDWPDALDGEAERRPVAEVRADQATQAVAIASKSRRRIRTKDPIVRAISRMRPCAAPVNRVHVRRLQALADRLDAGMPILPDANLVDWLRGWLQEMEGAL